MRLKTPVLVLVGFISFASFTQAVSPSGTQAAPLKHRILSEAKNGGKNEEGNARVQLSEIQGGIMDKVAPSKQTLTQVNQDAAVPSGGEKVPDSTTSSSSTPESGSTDTTNTEGVRSALTGIQALPDNNQKSLQYDNFGQPVLDFGNRVNSGQDRIVDQAYVAPPFIPSVRARDQMPSRRDDFSSSCSRSPSRDRGFGRRPNFTSSYRRDRHDNSGLGVGRLARTTGCAANNLGAPYVPIVGAPCVGTNPLLSGTTIPSADVEMSRALGFHLQPDVQLNRNEESAMAAAEETHREGCTSGNKYRHFQIKGDICVSEKVTFSENSVEEEQTAGRAAKNTVAVETTDVGDVLNGNQYDYQMDSRQGGLGGSLGLSCPGNDNLRNPFPDSCYDDRQCQSIDENYVCSTPDSCYVDDKLRGRRNKVCLPIRGEECSRKNENCEIDGYQGTCTDRGYCVPNTCRTDDDCQHDDLYFCMRTTKDVKNGRKGKCYLRSEL